MGKKSQRERREMWEQMQTKPQPVRLDELQVKMQERAKAARGRAPVAGAQAKRPWWQRLFGR